MAIKIALPKGRLLRQTAVVLQRAGWGLDEYNSKMGFYRPKSEKFPGLLIRVFHEKDIPIQIAMGNYDLGICGLDWIEELLVKYPSSDLMKVKDLKYGKSYLYTINASAGEKSGNGEPVRIATEYPNLAEALALRDRLGRFSVFPVWGAAEAYPPENADMVLLAKSSRLSDKQASPVLESRAFLIANRRSWESKALDEIVTSICVAAPEVVRESPTAAGGTVTIDSAPRAKCAGKSIVRLALPDGHQQQPTVKLLEKAGIEMDGYPSETGNSRPGINIPGVAVKVIRPQDMPLQVANGNFDLAVTGHDWVTDHLAQFPSSPVRELVDLKLARVRIVAVVSNELPVEDIAGLRQYIEEKDEPFRVASEYVNIADKFARDNHLGRYRIIPTWGATEGFLPEDADMLIENTETGRTIARHNLKIIDTLFVSTGCLIGGAAGAGAEKQRIIDTIVRRFQSAVEDD